MSFGGGGTNENDLRMARDERRAEQARLDAQEAERIRQQEQEAEDLRRWQNQLKGVYNNSLADAEAYFADMGVDPAAYLDKISRAADLKKNSVPELSTDVGSYFANLGQSVYDSALAAERSKALRGFNDFARDGFDRNLIADTGDDAVINAILGEQRTSAESDLQKLLARGVLTDTGYASSLKDLDNQSFGVKSAIEEITSALLEGGRSDLRNIISTGKSAANNLNLGEQFDAQGYNRQVNDAVTNFFAGLGDKARGSVGQDLFDISGAYNKGGSTQGAGNTGYSLNAALGAFDTQDEDNPDDKKKVDDWFAQF